MATINSLLTHLDERTIAQRVTTKHDDARLHYHLSSNTVADFNQFCDTIVDYYIYHHSRCVSRGGHMDRRDAYGEVNPLLDREYRRKHSNFISAYNDARDGTNGGMRVILDTIADALKARAIERYIMDVFDRHVAPNNWNQKCDIIRQFIAHCGPYLSSSIKTNQPERYAHDYRELIRSYVDGLRQTSSVFRRL